MRMGINGTIVIGIFCMVAVIVSTIMHQDFSWWVFPFSLLFGTIFAAILGYCFLTYREDRFRRASISDYPDEPWMWDARWRSKALNSRSKSEFWGLLAFTIILGMFALFGIQPLIEELPKGNLWVLLNLITIIAAVYFGRSTYTALKMWRLEHHVSLNIETRPAWVGKNFSALMKTADGYQMGDTQVWLEHFKIIRREESDGISFEKVVDHKLPGQIKNTDDGKSRISVDIPEKSPATSWNEDEQKRWWDLVIKTEVLGNQISLRYEIPVASPAKP